MEVFLADWISDEENQESVDVTSKCQNARMPGKSLFRHRHSDIRVSPVLLVTDKYGIAQLWTYLLERKH
jgi:hypothetical protein